MPHQPKPFQHFNDGDRVRRKSGDTQTVGTVISIATVPGFTRCTVAWDNGKQSGLDMSCLRIVEPARAAPETLPKNLKLIQKG